MLCQDLDLDLQALAAFEPPLRRGASAFVAPVTPLAHYLKYLDLAGAVLADPPWLVDGAVTGPGMNRTRRRWIRCLA